MEDKPLTTKELAERYGVPIETVWKWSAKGTGPAYFRIGKRNLYRVADVLAWEKSRVVEKWLTANTVQPGKSA